jgi:predicted phosphodiesterase/biotin operon repressor
VELRDAIAAALSKRAWSLSELARQFNSVESSIRGRISELRSQGVPILSYRLDGETFYVRPEGLAGRTEDSPSDFSDLAKFLKDKFRTIDEIAEFMGDDEPHAVLLLEQAKGAGLQIKEFPVGNVRFYTINLPPKTTLAVPEFAGDEKTEVVRFGIVSDTHLGSKYAMVDRLEEAYNLFEEQEITTVLHAGDMVDGNGRIFAGQMRELSIIPTPEMMALEVLNRYPRRKGIITHWIAGNHDTSWKRDGIDFPAYLDMVLRANGRSDMVHVGDLYGRVKIDGFVADLSHPSLMGGASLEKFIHRYYNKGNTPHMLIQGHWHCYREEIVNGIVGIQVPCLQGWRTFLPQAAFNDVTGFLICQMLVRDGRVKTKDITLYTCNNGTPQ